MSYADAIEQQMAVLSLFESERGMQYADELQPIAMQMYGHAMDAAGYCASIRSEVANASPYYVDATIVDVLIAAEASWPQGQRVTPQDLPTWDGWVTLGKDLPRFFPDVAPVAAISWQHMKVVPAIDGKSDEVGTFEALSVTGYIRTDVYWHPVPMLFEVVPFNGNLPTDPPHARLYRFLGCLFAFANQRIITFSSRPITNRQARKRVEKQLRHEPIVHVIELRRREYQQRDESHETHIEYTCQWLVRGHWRRQYFPASGENRPLWIAPHIKGPSDKPLKAPTITAYEVVR